MIDLVAELGGEPVLFTSWLCFDVSQCHWCDDDVCAWMCASAIGVMIDFMVEPGGEPVLICIMVETGCEPVLLIH